MSHLQIRRRLSTLKPVTYFTTMTTFANLQQSPTTTTSDLCRTLQSDRRRVSPIHHDIPVGQHAMQTYLNVFKTMIWTNARNRRKIQVLHTITHMLSYIFIQLSYHNYVSGAVKRRATIPYSEYISTFLPRIATLICSHSMLLIITEARCSLCFYLLIHLSKLLIPFSALLDWIVF